MSHQLMKKKVFPELGQKPVFVILIDNLRFDQWKVIEPVLTEYFNVDIEESYYSIIANHHGVRTQCHFLWIVAFRDGEIQPRIYGWVKTRMKARIILKENFLRNNFVAII